MAGRASTRSERRERERVIREAITNSFENKEPIDTSNDFLATYTLGHHWRWHYCLKKHDNKIIAVVGAKIVRVRKDSVYADLFKQQADKLGKGFVLKDEFEPPNEEIGEDFSWAYSSNINPFYDKPPPPVAEQAEPVPEDDGEEDIDPDPFSIPTSPRQRDSGGYAYMEYGLVADGGVFVPTNPRTVTSNGLSVDQGLHEAIQRRSPNPFSNQAAEAFIDRQDEIISRVLFPQPDPTADNGVANLDEMPF